MDDDLHTDYSESCPPGPSGFCGWVDDELDCGSACSVSSTSSDRSRPGKIDARTREEGPGSSIAANQATGEYRAEWRKSRKGRRWESGLSARPKLKFVGRSGADRRELTVPPQLVSRPSHPQHHHNISPNRNRASRDHLRYQRTSHETDSALASAAGATIGRVVIRAELTAVRPPPSALARTLRPSLIIPRASSLAISDPMPTLPAGTGRIELLRSAQFSHLSFSYPLKLLSPLPAPSAFPGLRVVYFLAYGGGLVSGDKIWIDIVVESGAARSCPPSRGV